MNPAVILALISDLYVQAQQAQQVIEQQQARIAELEARRDTAPPTEGT